MPCFSRCVHNILQYTDVTVFCLLTVYLVVSTLYRSDDSISHAGVTCQVRLLCYVLRDVPYSYFVQNLKILPIYQINYTTNLFKFRIFS